MENALRSKPLEIKEQYERHHSVEENPSFDYCTVAHLLSFNKNTVQWIFQIKGWRVRKRLVVFRSRIQALPSVAKAPDQHWVTALRRVGLTGPGDQPL